jgi:hypothetical protein
MGTLHKRFYRGITFGIEYTYVFKDNPRCTSLIAAFVVLINYELKKRGLLHKAHYDGGVVEINSPPFSTLNQAKKFYDVMENIVGQYPLMAKPKVDQMVCGGGGHIHFRPPTGTPRQLAFLYAKLSRFLSLHPYIAWMFNEWGDNVTAKNFNEILWRRKNYPIGQYNGVTHDLSLPNKYDVIRREYNPGNLWGCFASKGHVLRWDGEEGGGSKPLTFELRAFDAKESFKDVEDHILFCNAMISKVDDLAGVPVSPYNTQKKFLALGEKDGGVEGFRKLIRYLELPQKRYERFYPNFYMRARHGKLV